jgi:trehalose 6-phosphate phosphatase
LKAPICPPPTLDLAESALFLDLDGTLAKILPQPVDVRPDAERTRVLRWLMQSMDGRVAILSGRGLGDVDRILEGAVTSVAAVHGLEQRMPDGALVTHLPAPGLPEAKVALQSLANSELGLVVEDKGLSVALHYRQAPRAERRVRRATLQLARSLGLVLQEGSMVSELRTPGPDKGDALTAFLSQAPFAGHVPVMVGDDLTDEHAFDSASAAGGYGVLVGAKRPSGARYWLSGVADVLDWLRAGGAR